MKRYGRCFLFLLLVFCVHNAQSQESVRFQRVQTAEFYQNTVFCVVQDSLGFLWFGTIDGLLRYDGYNVITYRHHNWDSNSLSDNSISYLLVDHESMIWIGTWGGGLDVLNPFTGTFRNYRLREDDPGSIRDNRIQCLIEDSDKNIWIGTNSGGLSKWIRKENRFEHFIHDSSNNRSISGNRIWAIVEDGSKKLWIGTDEGLDRFDPFQNRFENFRQDPEKPDGLLNNRVRELLIDRKGFLWIGTQNGLNRYDPAKGIWRRYTHSAGDPASLSNDIVTALWEDRAGNIWIGTNRGGANRYFPSTDKFQRFIHEPGNPGSLSNIDVRCVFEDHSGNIWIGTRGGGLNKMDPKPKYFRLYRNDPFNLNSLSNNIIWSLYEDKKGYLWIGTDDGGLNQLDRKTGRFRIHKHQPENTRSLSHNRVWSVCGDHQGIIWAGTDRGLNRLNPATGQWTAYRHDEARSGGITNDFIFSVYEDSRKRLWAGTFGGIHLLESEKNTFAYFPLHTGRQHRMSQQRVTHICEDRRGHLWLSTDMGFYDFNPADRSFRHFVNDPRDTQSLSNNNVSVIYPARDNTIWIGTAEGLNALDPETSRFRRFLVRNGLKNDFIHGILEDGQGYIWISTNQGIARFNPKTGTSVFFDRYDGLQNESFNSRACFQNSAGEMFFGGVSGFNMFHPDSIRIDSARVRVVISSFNVWNHERLLYRNPKEQPSVVLSYRENFLTFEFSALDFAIPEKNLYTYRMEKLEDEWNYSGSRRFATYTNLDPGNYIFRVMATNHAGVWNDPGLSVTITIAPPFWQMGWFRLAVMALLIGSIIGIHKWRMYAIRQQNKKLERMVEIRTHELEEKKNELEKINIIVKSINSEIYLVSFLNTFLKETKVMRGVEKASALVFDQALGAFKFSASIGWDIARLQGIQMSLHEAESRYIKGSRMISDEIYIKKNLRESETHVHFHGIEIPKCVLVVRIKVEEKIGGYLIFDNFTDSDAFDEHDIQLLVNLKEHILSGFIKAKLLGELESANRELVKLNEKKNEFLGIAAHDLRNPLGAIIGFIDMIIHDIKEKNFHPDDGVAELEIVLKSARNMSQLINDLLDISAIESGKISLNLMPNDLNAILQDCGIIHRKAAQMKNIELEIVPNPDLPEVMADRNRIAEVVDNLVSNAIKYTFPGGKVRVSAEAQKPFAVVHVEDTGQGLDENDLKEMFASFKKLSTRPTGGESSTGLGLAIVKKIVEVHGGAIKVRSQKGKGSTFSFSLPLQ